MAASRASLAVVAVVLVAGALAGAFLLGGGGPSLHAEREAPPVDAKAPAPVVPSPPAEPEATDPARGIPSGRTSPVPDFEARRSARVAGRAVLRGGEPPRGGATVRIVTDKREIDCPATVARLGGREEMERLGTSGELEERARALGGWTWAHEARAGADGCFAIAVPPDLPRFRFQVVSDFAAYAEREAWFTLDGASGKAGVLLELEAAGKVVGVVSDPAGRPVGEGKSAASPTSRDWTMRRRTDRADVGKDGRFELPGLLPGRYEVAAVAPGFAPGTRGGVEVRANEVAGADVTLKVESFLAGRVVDAEGAGVPAARISAREAQGFGLRAVNLLGSGSARSGADGSFRIGSLGPGPHQVSARAEGKFPAEEQRLEVPPASGVESLRFVLEAGRAVSGRVVDATGAPIVGARVSARDEPNPRPGPRRWSHQMGKTAEDGAFRLTGLGDGPFVVEASLEGKGQAEVTGVATDAPPLEIVLRGPSGIAGVVRAEETGRPVPKFTVRSSRVERRGGFGMSSEGGPEGTFDSAEGAFELLNMKAGTSDLSVTAEGFVPGTAEGIEVKEGEVRRDVEVRLRTGAIARGRVVEAATGEPVVGASVAPVAGQRGPFVFMHMERGGGARSGSDGAFDVTGIEPGEARLTATHESFVEGTSDPIQAKAGAPVEGITISLSRGGAIDGFARGEDGAPLANGQVTARPEEFRGGRMRQGTPDETGYFRLEALPPGPTVVEARPRYDASPDWAEVEKRSLRATVQVEEGRTVRVEFLPPPKGGCTIRGRVLRGSAPVAGAWVHLRPKRGEEEARPLPFGDRLQAHTKEDGSFAIEHVPPGEATIGVSAMNAGEGVGSANRSFPLVVPEGREHVFDILLTGGEIAGRVTRAADGSGVAGASVQVGPEKGGEERAFRLGGWVHTDQEGRYLVRDLEPGTYVVTVQPEGQMPFGRAKEGPGLASDRRGGLEVVDGGRTTADFALGAGGTAVVTVLEPDGRPATRVWVNVSPAGETEPTFPFGHSSSGMTDEKGLAKVGGLAAGVYKASAGGRSFPFGGAEDDCPQAFSEEGAVRVGEETAFRIERKKGVRVRLRALGEKDEVLLGATFALVDARGNRTSGHAGGMFRPGPPKKEEEGTATVALLPGEYTLEVRSNGFAQKSLPIRVGSSSPQEVEVTLEREPKKK
ncbi:MAG: carboxypeptidase regulatory-like domain-containing protein [Planctomycetes bacterium]|nr:carboxypeptidase regulatory-like domain-containing protein [Planctomycetota bacterium]